MGGRHAYLMAGHTKLMCSAVAATCQQWWWDDFTSFVVSRPPVLIDWLHCDMEIISCMYMVAIVYIICTNYSVLYNNTELCVRMLKTKNDQVSLWLEK